MDPIDGTEEFVHGSPTFGTMLASIIAARRWSASSITRRSTSRRRRRRPRDAPERPARTARRRPRERRPRRCGSSSAGSSSAATSTRIPSSSGSPAPTRTTGSVGRPTLTPPPSRGRRRDGGHAQSRLGPRPEPGPGRGGRGPLRRRARLPVARGPRPERRVRPAGGGGRGWSRSSTKCARGAALGNGTPRLAGRRPDAHRRNGRGPPCEAVGGRGRWGTRCPDVPARDGRTRRARPTSPPLPTLPASRGDTVVCPARVEVERPGQASPGVPPRRAADMPVDRDPHRLEAERSGSTAWRERRLHQWAVNRRIALTVVAGLECGAEWVIARCPLKFRVGRRYCVVRTGAEALGGGKSRGGHQDRSRRCEQSSGLNAMAPGLATRGTPAARVRSVSCAAPASRGAPGPRPRSVEESLGTSVVAPGRRSRARPRGRARARTARSRGTPREADPPMLQATNRRLPTGGVCRQSSRPA